MDFLHPIEFKERTAKEKAAIVNTIFNGYWILMFFSYQNYRSLRAMITILFFLGLNALIMKKVPILFSFFFDVVCGILTAWGLIIELGIKAGDFVVDAAKDAYEKKADQELEKELRKIAPELFEEDE